MGRVGVHVGREGEIVLLTLQLIGQSETTTLKTILYIESPSKSIYHTDPSDWLFDANESIMPNQ